ncbi:MAG: EamA family transporter [Candidatus Delongbacteria bacterium]|nr:EamA family transporter [Candidatus Delongbacteria bacterium]
MICLLLAILSSASIALILKLSENRNLNRYAVTSSNYVAAFTISIIFSIQSSSVSFEPGPSLNSALVIGLFGGVLYFLGFIFIQKSIRVNGVGITGAVAKTGIILPVILSMILWKEIPNILQSVGVILSLAAIVMINISPRELDRVKGVNKTIILLFLIVGFAEFSNKLFEIYGGSDYKAVFLFVVFFTAFWVSMIFTLRGIRKGQKVTKTDIITGILVGIPNMFASYFLIESFNYYKASVVFPTVSSGTIVMINLGGYFIFGERLKRKEIFAVAMIIVAIVLMNLK